jgi:hypothetical protein
MTEPTEGREAELDARLSALPRSVEPGRDLWPAIEARLDAPDILATRRRPRWLWQAAAAVALVAGSSLLTATLLDRGWKTGKTAAVHAPAARRGDPRGMMAMPAAFGPHVRLDHEYQAARHQLTAMLQDRLARMPPSTRAKLEVNLAEMRRAAEQINAALAEQPGDPLLEELLLETYQDELAVLANVNQLTNDLAATPVASKRIKL